MAEASEMTKDDFDRAYGLLSGVFADVRGQVQFAEAKNGALFASTMALIVGISTILFSADDMAGSIGLWLGLTSIGLAGGSFFALISFLPIMGKKRHRYAKGREGSGENLVYWGEIKHFTPSAYAEAILLALRIDATTPRLLLDLAEQVVINSGIAERKFRLFSYGAWTTMYAIMLPAVAFFGWLLVNGLRVP